MRAIEFLSLVPLLLFFAISVVILYHLFVPVIELFSSYQHAAFDSLLSHIPTKPSPTFSSPSPDPLAHVPFSFNSCPSTRPLSCSLGTENLDPCCTPLDHGVLVLVQQWNQRLGPPNAFTLYGAWPHKCHDGSSSSVGMHASHALSKQPMPPVSTCDPSRRYPELNLTDFLVSKPQLLGRLQEYWPIYASSSHHKSAFWKMQWEKFGTCLTTLSPRCVVPASKLMHSNRQLHHHSQALAVVSSSPPPHPPAYDDVYAYLDLALSLRDQFDLYQILTRNGIVPSETAKYDVEHVRRVLLQALGGHAHAMLCCSSTGVLTEIRIWLRARGSGRHVQDWIPVEWISGRKGGGCAGKLSWLPKKPLVLKKTH